jgi:hypothetical protein
MAQDASLIERRYKKGTPFVPKTGPAIVDKGEAVIPKKANPFANLKKKKKKKGKKGGIAAMLANKFPRGGARPGSDSDYA